MKIIDLKMLKTMEELVFMKFSNRTLELNRSGLKFLLGNRLGPRFLPEHRSGLLEHRSVLG